MVLCLSLQSRGCFTEGNEKKKKKEGEIKPVGTFETNNQNKSRQKKNGRKKEKLNDRPDENATNRSTISLN